MVCRQEIALLQLQFQQFGGAAIVVNGIGSISNKVPLREALASDPDTAADETSTVKEVTHSAEGVDGEGENATICTDPRCERGRLHAAQKHMAEIAAVKSKAEEKVYILLYVRLYHLDLLLYYIIYTSNMYCCMNITIVQCL